MHIVDALQLLIWPLAACLCIGLLHAYAGLHVLRRGVIFVDLALAQMAALGGVVGANLHAHAHQAPVAGALSRLAPAPANAEDELTEALRTVSPPPAAPETDEEDHAPAILNLWSIGFALGGAVLLAFARMPDERVPHEAIIGIVYVVAAAATVLVLSKSPHAHEQMEEMLTGRLLFVDRATVLATAGLYAGLGVVHWLLRRPLIAISEGRFRGSGLTVRLWDCAFYAIFALMVTRSVAIGGVLVVFSFLIIPGACAAAFVSSMRARLLLAWLIAVIVSVLGLWASAAADLPSGSTLVAVFGLALVICLLAGGLMRVRTVESSE